MRGAGAEELHAKREAAHHQPRAVDHAELAPDTPPARTLAVTAPRLINKAGTANKDAFEADMVARVAALRVINPTYDTPPPTRSKVVARP